MLCFRDMTFCSAACANDACPRKFDDEQKLAALRWWKKPGAPVAFGDLSEGCPDYQPLAQEQAP